MNRNICDLIPKICNSGLVIFATKNHFAEKSALVAKVLISKKKKVSLQGANYFLTIIYLINYSFVTRYFTIITAIQSVQQSKLAFK